MNCNEVKKTTVAYVIYKDRTIEHEMDRTRSAYVEGGQYTQRVGKKNKERQLARHKRR
jgi:hypothetical protein